MKIRQNIISDYFTFSKRQRNGILIAIGLMAICLCTRFGYSFFVETKTVPIDTSFFNKVTKIKLADSANDAANYDNKKHPYTSNYNNNRNENKPTDRNSTYTPKGDLFDFDPNTLSADGWKKLGLRDKTIQTIQNYLSKGGKFKHPDDIRKVYGLFPDQIERLLPYIKIANEQSSTNYKDNRATSAPTYSKPVYTPRPVIVKTIDINNADTSAFIALPGIGSKLAMRIVVFREKLGGFASVNQIKEVYGLQDSVFQQIKSRFVIGNASVKQLNINTADANTLKLHPYLKWNIANAIVQYRTQHGNFTSLTDLKKIAIIDDETFGKMQPYLTL